MKHPMHVLCYRLATEIIDKVKCKSGRFSTDFSLYFCRYSAKHKKQIFFRLGFFYFSNLLLYN